MRKMLVIGNPAEVSLIMQFAKINLPSEMDIQLVTLEEVLELANRPKKSESILIIDDLSNQLSELTKLNRKTVPPSRSKVYSSSNFIHEERIYSFNSEKHNGKGGRARNRSGFKTKRR